MSASKKRKGLGSLGVDVLLSTPVEPVPSTTAYERGSDTTDAVNYVAVDLIDRSPYQPRQHMPVEGIQELADSIRAQGLIQPVIVRMLADRYELIAGERRWRAAQLAGLQEIPVVVKDVNDQTAAAMALVENLQREDLNPIEEAYAMSNLIKQFDWTHQEVADAVGKARATVSNSLRLLELASEVRELMKEKYLSMGHARALLALAKDHQGQIAQTVVAKQLSVRQTEQLIRKLTAGNNGKSVQIRNQKDPNIQDLENRLADTLGAHVAIKHGEKSNKGKIVIRYNNLDELDGILQKMGN